MSRQSLNSCSKLRICRTDKVDARHGRTLYASAAFSKSGAAASQSGLSLKSSKLGDQYCMHKGRHNQQGAVHLAAGVELVFNRCDLQP